MAPPRTTMGGQGGKSKRGGIPKHKSDKPPLTSARAGAGRQPSPPFSLPSQHLSTIASTADSRDNNVPRPRQVMQFSHGPGWEKRVPLELPSGLSQLELSLIGETTFLHRQVSERDKKLARGFTLYY